MIDTIHPIPAFTDNYIWAIHSADSNQVCIVDPGDAAPVLDYIENNGLELTAILITHHHPDHVGGLANLTQAYKPRVYGPEISRIKGITHFVQEGDSLEIFDCEFRVLEVPGHTLDHIAYYSSSQAQPMLFCGDTLFAAGCGRLFEGSPAMMHDSLAKIAALPASTLVYCTHEYTLANLAFAKAVDPTNAELLRRITQEQQKREFNNPTLPSTLKLELKTNPFLRCDDADLARSINAHTNGKLESSVELFAALRQWKDNF